MAGIAGIQNAMTLTFAQVGAGATNNDYTLTRAGVITDAWNHAQANQVGGTVQVFRQALGSGAFNAVTDAMNAGVQTALTHAGVMATNQVNCSATDVIRFATVGAATQAVVNVVYVPWALAAATTIP